MNKILKENVELEKYSNLKIGGSARFFAAVKTREEALQALKEARETKLPICILAGGTNVLLPDGILNEVVIKPEFQETKLEGEKLRVGAGVIVKDLLDFCVENRLSGLEWAGGLPGTVGGAVYGNAGAFGGEMKDSIEEVASIDYCCDELNLLRRNNQECQFKYRDSIFKQKNLEKKGELIIEIIFNLHPGEKEAIQSIIQEKIDYRNDKQPLDYPNIGSFFKNIDWQKLPKEVRERFAEKKKTDPFDVLPVAVLIDAAGLKGRRVRDAMVSEKHPNFIVNAGRANAKDIRELTKIVAKEINKQFKIELEREVIFLK